MKIQEHKRRKKGGKRKVVTVREYERKSRRKIGEHHVISLLIALLWIACAVDSVSALPWDTPVTENWWQRSDAHTVNGNLGYVLNISRTYTAQTVDISAAGDSTAYWAYRIYILHNDNSTTELTSSYDLNVSRASDGTGLQNTTWTPATTVLNLATEAIRMDLYMRIGAGAWTNKAFFLSSRLETKELQNGTWTLRLWTNRTYSGGNTYAEFNWGSEAYESRVENVRYAKLDPWETQDHWIRNADFFQFIVAPWTYYIGDAFWGFMLFFIAITTYNKFGDIRPVIVEFWLFGGTGGLLGLLLPWFSLPLAWFFLSFVLATTLYILIR